MAQVKLFNGVSNTDAMIQQGESSTYAAPTKLLNFIVKGETSRPGLQNPVVNLAGRIFTTVAVVLTGVLPAFLVAKAVAVLSDSEKSLEGSTLKAVNAFKARQSATSIGMNKTVDEDGNASYKLDLPERGILSLLSPFKNTNPKTLKDNQQKALKDLAGTIGKHFAGVKTIEDCFKVAKAFAKDIDKSIEDSGSLDKSDREQFVGKLKEQLYREVLKTVLARMTGGTEARRRGLGNMDDVYSTISEQGDKGLGVSKSVATVKRDLRELAKEELTGAERKQVIKSLEKERGALRSNGKQGQAQIKSEQTYQKKAVKEREKLEGKVKKELTALQLIQQQRTDTLKKIAALIEGDVEKVVNCNLDQIREIVVCFENQVKERKEGFVRNSVENALEEFDKAFPLLRDPTNSQRIQAKGQYEARYHSQVAQEFAKTSKVSIELRAALDALEKLEGSDKKGYFNDRVEQYKKDCAKIAEMKKAELDRDATRNALVAQDSAIIDILNTNDKPAISSPQSQGFGSNNDAAKLPKEILGAIAKPLTLQEAYAKVEEDLRTVPNLIGEYNAHLAILKQREAQAVAAFQTYKKEYFDPKVELLLKINGDLKVLQMWNGKFKSFNAKDYTTLELRPITDLLDQRAKLKSECHENRTVVVDDQNNPVLMNDGSGRQETKAIDLALEVQIDRKIDELENNLIAVKADLVKETEAAIKSIDQQTLQPMKAHLKNLGAKVDELDKTIGGVKRNILNLQDKSNELSAKQTELYQKILEEQQQQLKAAYYLANPQAPFGVQQPFYNPGFGNNGAGVYTNPVV